MNKKSILRLISYILMFCIISTQGLNNSILYADAETSEDRIAAHQALPVETDSIPNWPAGPVVAAESAILMEATTGAILYEKNIHKHQYPASTTKILTSLIAYEECSLSEVVTFSHNAVFSIPAGSNNIAIDEGEQLTMEECLNAILIRSANEVCYAVAEHIGGSFEGFADMMNAKAKELGCVDSNFVNPNGLPDENHYTSAYDLAMIGREFFANEFLCNITTTPTLKIDASERQPDNILEQNKMALIPGREYAYEYLVGCKTGYTDAARSTLVSCAEKDGLKLICVVLNDENPNYYQDTIALFNYGFGNFDYVNISETETRYNIDSAGSFYSDNDIFGNSKPILSLNKYDGIVLPKTIGFQDVTSTISYDTENDNQACLITYTYNGRYLGEASVDFSINDEAAFSFTTVLNEEKKPSKETSYIFINIVKVFLGMLGVLAFASAILFIRKFTKSYKFIHRTARRRWRRDRKKYASYDRKRMKERKINHKKEIKEAKRRIRRNRRKRQ